MTAVPSSSRVTFHGQVLQYLEARAGDQGVVGLGRGCLLCSLAADKTGRDQVDALMKCGVKEVRLALALAGFDLEGFGKRCTARRSTWLSSKKDSLAGCLFRLLSHF